MAWHRDGAFSGGASPDVVAGAVTDAFAAVLAKVELERSKRGHPAEYGDQQERTRYAWSVELHVVFEPDEKGWVRATIEELPGVITCAPTLVEARELVRDALAEWLASLTSSERASVGVNATRETLTLSVA